MPVFPPDPAMTTNGAQSAITRARAQQRADHDAAARVRRDGYVSLATLAGLAWTVGYLAGRGLDR